MKSNRSFYHCTTASITFVLLNNPYLWGYKFLFNLTPSQGLRRKSGLLDRAMCFHEIRATVPQNSTNSSHLGIQRSLVHVYHMCTTLHCSYGVNCYATTLRYKLLCVNARNMSFESSSNMRPIDISVTPFSFRHSLFQMVRRGSRMGVRQTILKLLFLPLIL